ncbi:PDZ domain-containing protein [bacterium]|nr:PDZ domain-containing protein [bacterium]
MFKIILVLVFLVGNNFAAQKTQVPSPIKTSKDFAQIFQTYKNAVVQVEFIADLTTIFGGKGDKFESNTIGIVVSDTGIVMISDHIFPNTTFNPSAKVEDFKIIFSEEKTAKAKIIDRDEDLQVAFLQIEEVSKRPKTYLKFSSEAINVGDETLMITTLDKEQNYSKIFYNGYVNGILKTPKDFVSVSIPSHEGNIGSPIIDLKTGLGIGVVGLPEETGFGRAVEFCSFVSTSKRFAKALENLSQKVNKSKAWLGIETQPLTEEMAIYWKIKGREGVVISTILPDSPADKAGLSEGDVITSINSTQVFAREDYQLEVFRNLVREFKPNDEAIFTVIRDGEDQVFGVTFGEAPKSSFFAEEYKNEEFGVTVVELTFDIRKTFNIANQISGVYVADVEPASWIALAGISNGDVIQKINSTLILTVEDFATTLEKISQSKDKEVTFFVLRGIDTSLFLVKTDFNN